jgi:D-3-phosphoglycerate dehydrogenase
VAASLDVLVRGEIAELDVSVLQLAALKGVFSEVVEEQVTFVNAPGARGRARRRDLAVDRPREPRLPQPRHRPRRAAGRRPVSVSGTLTGPRQVEKLTEVDGFDLELVAERNLVFFRYHDRPGVVGLVGARLGEAGVNIAGAQVSRTEQGGRRSWP